MLLPVDPACEGVDSEAGGAKLICDVGEGKPLLEEILHTLDVSIREGIISPAVSEIVEMTLEFEMSRLYTKASMAGMGDIKA
jgi:hypothetical protein